MSATAAVAPSATEPGLVPASGRRRDLAAALSVVTTLVAAAFLALAARRSTSSFHVTLSGRTAADFVLAVAGYGVATGARGWRLLQLTELASPALADRLVARRVAGRPGSSAASPVFVGLLRTLRGAPVDEPRATSVVAAPREVGRRARYAAFTRIGAEANLLTAVLPLALGEGALPVRLRRAGASWRELTVVTVTGRMLDLAAVGTLGVIGALAGLAQGGGALWLVPLGAGAGALLASGVVLIVGTPRRRNTRPLRLPRRPLAASVVPSLLSWLGAQVATWALLHAVGIDAGPLVTGAMVVITVGVSAVPYPSALGLGTVEVGWLAAFAVTLPDDDRVGSALTLHLLTLLCLVVCWAGTVALSARPRHHAEP